MNFLKLIVACTIAVAISACAGTQPDTNSHPDADKDLGVWWVKHSAEYQAISAQVYAQATQDLPRLLNDASWSAVPGKPSLGLPPAIILDVDETVVSNVDFQLILEPPFTNRKMDTWGRQSAALPIRGVRDFVIAARDAGVTVFFVTNRPCEKADGDDCPAQSTTVEDLREVGLEVSPEFVLLSGEKPEWGREKVVRRELIAKSYRVIMLVGDDFGDFVACSRHKPVAPCAVSATRQSREEAVETYANYWGNGWYILPNPMHGSWTSVR